jgi:hypothetical protein
MKLVEPGPQPPPFNVEYSELEADKARTEERPDDDSTSIESSSEGASPVQPAKTPDAGSAGSTAESQLSPAVETVETANGNADSTDVADSFGAGLDVGDEVAQPVQKEQSAIEVVSAAAATVEATAEAEVSGESEVTNSDSDSGGKKRGKRPNRRRRSRRGQKKDGGSAPKSES